MFAKRFTVSILIVVIITSITSYYVIASAINNRPVSNNHISDNDDNVVEKAKLHKISSVEIVIDEKLAKYYNPGIIRSNLIVERNGVLNKEELGIKTIITPSNEIAKYIHRDKTYRFIVLAWSNYKILSMIKYSELKNTNTFIIIIDDTGKGIIGSKLYTLGYPFGSASGGVITENGIEHDLIGAVMFGYIHGTYTGILYSEPPSNYDPLHNLNNILATAISNIDSYYSIPTK